METNSNSNKVAPKSIRRTSEGTGTFIAKTKLNPMLLLGLMANVKEKKVDKSGQMRISH